MLKLIKDLKAEIFQSLKKNWPLESSEITIGITPQQKMGDLSLVFPFLLAKKLKRNPREIALEICPTLSSLDEVDKVEVAGGGYINIYLDKKKTFLNNLFSLGKTSLSADEDKIIVEHTSINPNKAAHIGHIRNSCLGDTLARCLIYKGENVEIQNYIDDTGVQVADVVFGFLELEKKGLNEIKKIEGKFDYYCWDLYTKVTSFIEKNPETQTRKSDILRKIEDGIDPESKIANHISRRILKAHLNTMRRLDISYDLQATESCILELKFWEKAFRLLKEKKVIHYVEDGAHKGCWVMELEDDPDQEKIIVRSNGIVTYVGKDIAYQLWKCGILEKDFNYEPFVKQNGKTIWITTSTPTGKTPQFGNGSMVYNVIDTRQSYTQKVVVQGLRSLNYRKHAERSIHFAYEMVALSPESFKELDLEIPGDKEGKEFFEISGRKGLGVKADDLLDRLEKKALAEVEQRNPQLPQDQKIDIAKKIGIGALRYFMLKYARNSIIVFDFDDALNFEGETGPYLQYTLVRIKSIFRKMRERDGFEEKDIKSLIQDSEVSIDALKESEMEDFWELILYASQLDKEVLHSIRSLELLHLAKFTFTLCQKFNAFYHKYPILSENNRKIKELRILTIYYINGILSKTLSLMGIPKPDRM